MLVLTRKVGERIRVGDDVTITVVRINGNAARIGVEAPPQYVVARAELIERPELAADDADAAASRAR